MSINIARSAFAKGLGSAGQIQGCTMKYVTVEGARVQRFAITYVKEGVKASTDVDVAPMGNIEAALFGAAQAIAQGD